MSAEGFIGSTISLISRSDIRYVGILHSINAQESTIALEKVRSFGTEGRKGNPAEEIAASDHVFEYIVFRGSDVKDLNVCEAPPAPQPPAVPNDPAILQTTAPPQPPGFQNYGNNDVNRPKETGGSFGQPQPAYPNRAQQYWQQPGHDASAEPQSKESAGGIEQNGASDRLPGMGGHLTHNNRRGRGNRRHNGRDRNNIPIPSSDFDFESSNAKFDKTELLKEIEDDEVPEQPVEPSTQPFYNKSTSFFDNISCEAKERMDNNDGRPRLSFNERRERQHHERQLNLETFGQTSVDSSRYRGRGRGGHRGRGSGGGSRGGRGGYNHNNYRNVGARVENGTFWNNNNNSSSNSNNVANNRV
ncbi:hypothetical protein K493DRAFT_313298 [Basidiobolus meristosporus CBS 931.73]|uniref:TFG box profile domain-containing protein n=1 Tax=Basidiobolus meristosporus CBS 931.73 TaxID=1314790 RepID=A0A1Y1YN51_9FUNG|nr:hypothetical protein K493DRAFT_313298 [Basidiobolus meristosporus CBS 931.73]|eukprot:ORX99263.1 hypothetical protein K493DRAFT_313298 [Basidiobolus meristosporus CBS 931.73]